MSRHSSVRLIGFANLITALAALTLVVSIVLWFVAQRLAGFDWTFDGPGFGRLIVCSRDGRMVIGLDDHSPDYPSRFWGTRPRGLNDLISDDDRLASADLWCWGVAAPHWLVAGLLCLPILWRVLVWRDHAEEVHRRTYGLCRHCGYDIRASIHRCPECGNRIAAGGIESATAAGDAA